ncbi:hypothetical protein Lser_V15G08597 [Lactuca serriola]|uniref:Uncharacterized protein n=1 Tax=Lactuca sativa TaxID=4236 RepID=A0A9R1WAD6_LACSA|nr:hypothetical protein LSAT_V11C200092040 [Lactuca sativa]
MAKQFQAFPLFILVLFASARTLQAIAPASAPSPIPYWLRFAPGSAPSQGPVPIPPPVIPPPSTGGGGGGGVPTKDSGGGSSGLSGGQKAGITLGVLAGAGLIGFATVVYMKRRSNIQRARFGASARRSQL